MHVEHKSQAYEVYEQRALNHYSMKVQISAQNSLKVIDDIFPKVISFPMACVSMMWAAFNDSPNIAKTERLQSCEERKKILSVKN